MQANEPGATMRNNGTLTNASGATLTNKDTVWNAGTQTGAGTYTQSAGQTINIGTVIQASIETNDGSLHGTELIVGQVTIGSGATVMPGVPGSPGTLTINGPFSSSGHLDFEIPGIGNRQCDVLHIDGSATFTGGALDFAFINGFQATAGESWEFLCATSITGWDTLTFNVAGLGAGLVGEVDRIIGGAELRITQQPVPEPSATFLLALGLAGVLGYSWRQKTQTA